MAITKMSNSGIKTGNLKYDSMLAGNPAYVPSGFFSIATLTASGGETSMTFSGIPQTYKALQIRTFSRRNAAGAAWTGLRINGDTTATNYSYSYAQFDSANGLTYVTAQTNSFIIGARMSSNTIVSGIFAGSIFELDNYASTTQNKSVQYIGGFNDNGSSGNGLGTYGTGAWYSTSAITSITMYFLGDGIAAGSTFALYGVS